MVQKSNIIFFYNIIMIKAPYSDFSSDSCYHPLLTLNRYIIMKHLILQRIL